MGTVATARRRASLARRVEAIREAAVKSHSIPYILKAARVVRHADAILAGLAGRSDLDPAWDYFVGGGLVRQMQEAR